MKPSTYMGALITFALATSCSSVAAGPTNWPNGSISSDEMNRLDRFGYHVIVAGNRAFVSSAGDLVGTNTSQGAVFVFTKVNGVWTHAQKITAQDGTAYDEFGSAIYWNGEYLTVTAPGAYIDAQHTDGAIYEFTWSPTLSAFVQSSKFFIPDGSPGGLRNIYTVARNSMFTFVGGYDIKTDGTTTGTVRIFQKMTLAGGWTETQVLVSPPHTPNIGGDWDEYGTILDASDSHLVVGGIYADINGVYHAGAAYAYGLSGGSWQLERTFTGDATTSAMYGSSISIVGHNLLIGASGEGDNFAGAVHVWHYSPVDAKWYHDEKIQANLQCGLYCFFGNDVAWEKFSLAFGDPSMGPQSFIVGAIGAGDYPFAGSALVYDKINGTWTNTAALTYSTPSTYMLTDGGVSLSGHTAIAATYNYDDFGDPGIAVVFTEP